MRVYFTITGPGPRYAHSRRRPASAATPARTSRIPTRFSGFVEAVGKRYSGTYRDENGVRRPLPRVALWSIWNEPNQPGWLSPQWERPTAVVPSRRRCTASSTRPASQGLERSRPRRPTRSSSARRRRWARRRTGPRNGDQAGPVPARAALPEARRHAVRRRPTRPRRDCDDFAKNGPLKAIALRPSPVHEEGRADGRADSARRDHDREHRRARAAAGRALGAVGRQDPGRPADPADRVRLRVQPARHAQRHPLPAPGAVQPARASSSPTTTRACRRRRSSCCATSRR